MTNSRSGDFETAAATPRPLSLPTAPFYYGGCFASSRVYGSCKTGRSAPVRGLPLRRVMFVRRTALAALAALVFAAPAYAQADRSLLMPGVSYTRQVEFTSHGAVVMHVLNAPRPGGLYGLEPVLSNDLVIAREPLTAIEQRLSASATVAGVDADLFNAHDGYPSGILMRHGVLDSPPLAARTSIGIAADGTLQLDRVRSSGYWRGTGQRRPLTFNQPPTANGVSLYTPSWGPTTPPFGGTVEAVLSPFTLTRPNTDLGGPVVQILQTGNTPIPPGGAVLVGRGSGGQKIATEAPVGTQVTARLTFDKDWSGIVSAVGGGPLIVRNGKPVFRAFESFSAGQLAPREARGAVGQLKDGRIVLVTVDGGEPGYSVGMTNFELALAMMRLGCVRAAGLGFGEAAAMAFDGQLLSRPSADGAEQPISDALLLTYTGVYAPPLAEPVLSPNGDGVAEQQTLAYKLVRPASVTAVLFAPDGSTRPVDSGFREPGIYKFTWTGKAADGTTPEPEGKWRFSVTADDSQGRSTADRLFAVDETLAALALSPAPPGSLWLRHGSLEAAFTLAHDAAVTVTVETPAGIVIRRLVRATLATGPHTVTWNGKRDGGAFAFAGRYVVHVSATNASGTVDLSQPFLAHR